MFGGGGRILATSVGKIYCYSMPLQWAWKLRGGGGGEKEEKKQKKQGEGANKRPEDTRFDDSAFFLSFSPVFYSTFCTPALIGQFRGSFAVN